MVEAVVGFRAHNAQLFAEEVQALVRARADFADSSNRAKESANAYVEAWQSYSKYFILRRALARIGFLLGRSTIYSSVIEAKREVNDRVETVRYNGSLISACVRGIEYYGGNKPGDYPVTDLLYDARTRTFTVGFDIRTKVGDGDEVFKVAGDFSELHYRTKIGKHAFLSIPKDGNLLPVLSVPSSRRLVEVIGSDGPGSFDNYQAKASWTPRKSLKSRPIDPEEFCYL